MSATKALQTALDFGVLVEVSGDDLLLAAVVEPSTSVLDSLARYKLEIIRILRPTDIGPTAEDCLALFDERAGIAEFDGGQPRELAELLAIGSSVLDAAMGKTSGKELERFIRSLPDHICRSQRSLGLAKHSVDRRGSENSETTP
jgi:hypothetical protein